MSYITATLPLAKKDERKKSVILTYMCLKEEGKKRSVGILTTTARDEGAKLLSY